MLIANFGLFVPWFACRADMVRIWDGGLKQKQMEGGDSMGITWMSVWH